MSGTHITLDVDDRGVRQILDRMTQRASHIAPALAAVGEALVHSTWRRFEAEKGPGGVPWQELSDTHAIERAGGLRNAFTRRGGLRVGFLRRLNSQKILTDTSRLRDSVAYRVEDNGVVVGTNMVYGAIHQLGGTIKPKNGRFLRWRVGDQDVFARQVTIPARPYLGIDDEDERTISEIIESHLTDYSA